MKLVHLSAVAGNVGGAARASYRLHAALRATGIESTMLTLISSTDDPDVHLASGGAARRRVRAVLGTKAESLLRKCANPRPGTVWTTGLIGSQTLTSHPEVVRADALMLYWLGAGFASSVEIGNILRLGKPVVWRLSDMWAFTGGCHYSSGCQGYRNRCGNCPQLGSSRGTDLSRLAWWVKRLAWRSQNLTIVCPSTWMAERVRSSSLLRSNPVRVIHTGVDVSVYRPTDRMQARQLLGLPRNARIVLAGADGLRASPRKGLPYLVEALERCRPAVPDVHLVLFGTSSAPKSGIATTALGNIRDERLLALVYGAADVFAYSGLEDNLPNTVLEAMACGLPVVAFDIGGVRDAIRHGDTGLLCIHGDVGTFSSLLGEVLLDEQERRVMGSNARETVLDKFDLHKQAGCYAALLRDLVTEHARRLH